MDDLRAALRGLNGGILAFDSQRMPDVLAIIADLARGDVSDSRLRALQRPTKSAVGSTSRPTLAPMAGAGNKNVAIIAMRGIALYDLDYFPFAFSTRLLARNIAALAADPSIASIVISIDTPGGHVTGTQEAADAVWNARKKKPVIGIVDPLCASAGYWIGSQCTKIIGVPSADVGSIGVFMMHTDMSKMLSDAGIKPTFVFAGPHKVESNPYEPLSSDAKTFLQSEVNKTYADFTAAVARGRGTTVDSVKARMGGGRCLGGRDALKAGMIDAIATPDAALQSVVSGSLSSSRQSATTAAEYRTRLAALAAESVSPADEARRRLAILSA